MKSIPKSLKTWFTIHFIVDILFAIPLIVAPIWTLGLFGLTGTEMLTARLVGAALIGIGGTSFLVRNSGFESYNNLLTLKILWSVSAMVGILLTIYQGAPKSAWIIFGIFFVFSGIWVYYKRRLNK